MRKRTRSVVVGAGLGGLAAAIRLRTRGHEVTLVEALDQPGGRARVFRRDGYSFDAGPTVITAPYLLDELFALGGRDRRDYFELVPVDPFYRIQFQDGTTFDYTNDDERLLAQIEQLSPRDVDGYRQLARKAEKIFDTGYLQLADQPFHELSTMLRVLPSMVRLESYRSVYGLVAKHIRDERLRQVFTFEPLLVGGHPFRTTSIYLLIHWLERKWGVHFALGGTASVVSSLAKLFEEMGGDIRLSSPVREIDVHANGAGPAATGVVLESGERILADVVVCNSDPSTTYSRMLPVQARKRHSDRSVKAVRQSMGLFVGYFGVDRTYPELAHHTILLGPRYRELLDDIFVHRRLADDFSLYLHAPTRTDPTLAPPGHDTMYVLSPVPNLKAGVNWQREADQYFDRILQSLEHRLLPNLRKHVTTRFTMTPAEFESDLRSMDGAAFGPEPILRQSAWFRYHNKSPDVSGLYFVGAGTHPGGGVPGVLCSAKVLERVLDDA